MTDTDHRVDRPDPEASPRRASTLGLVGVVHGPPRDPHTWSGISANLFAALGQRCRIEGLVDVAPPPPWPQVAKAASFSPVGARWRAKYSVSPVMSHAMTRQAGRALGRLPLRPDAVLQAGSWYDLTAVPALQPRVRALYIDADIALYAHRPDIPVGPDQRWVRRRVEHERRVYDRVDAVFTFSRWLARSVVEDFGQPADKVHVVGAGANLADIPGPVVRDWSRPRFLFVGRKWERKGGPQLVEAFRAVRAAHRDAELWIVGPDEAPPAQEGVRFIGFVSTRTAAGRARLGQLYRDATAFVMPSRFEPFGIVFLEAMAYGLPCIGTDSCAMPEIIHPGESGYLAPDRDVEALADRMLRLADDPDRAARMGAAGRARMLAEHRWEHVADRMVRVLEARARRG